MECAAPVGYNTTSTPKVHREHQTSYCGDRKMRTGGPEHFLLDSVFYMWQGCSTHELTTI